MAAHAQTKAGTVGHSYLVVPYLSEAPKARLEQRNIEHIEGTLKDFTSWYQQEFPDGVGITQIQIERKPYLGSFESLSLSDDDIRALNDIQVIDKQALLQSAKKPEKGSISPFYKGFKASWDDIVNAIPAHLEVVDMLNKAVLSDEKEKLVVLIGSAGSGKSTALMMSALEVSEEGKAVFFLVDYADELSRVIELLEKSHPDGYVLYIDKLSLVDRQVRYCLELGILGGVLN